MPKKKTDAKIPTSFRLPEDLVAAVRDAALLEERTVLKYVERALRAAVERTAAASK